MQKEPNPTKFHHLYGAKASRLVFRDDDFLDYVLMNVLTWFVSAIAFGPTHPLSILTLLLCGWMVSAFLKRHGCRFRVPTIVKRPQDVLFMLAYKIQNIQLPYVVAAVFLLLEHYLIRFTPDWPHEAELMRKIGFGLFYVHLAALTAYRTVILFSHLRHKEHVRDFLMKTSWKVALNRQPSISLEILHAYFTGLLTHVILLAPWYMAIAYFDHSLVLLPVTIPLGIFIHARFLRVVNKWFYRDHWLGHNSELEFLYLHGSHHDVIPSGLIGVSGNGYLEGFMRHAIGGPGIFYSPVVTFLIHTFDVKIDIDGHQFIPGIYPHVPKSVQQINQHSTHHFGKLEPYSLGLKLDQPGVPEDLLKKAKLFTREQQNSVELDEQLTGFQWDNQRYREYLALYDEFQVVKPRDDASPIETKETGVL